MKGGNNCQEGIGEKGPGKKKWIVKSTAYRHVLLELDSKSLECHLTAVRLWGSFWGFCLLPPSPLETLASALHYVHLANSCCRAAPRGIS